MRRFLLDTDIGDDIDDALALVVALKENIDLLAVTTVFKNTKERALIAKKIISFFDKKIPVYAGYGATLSGNVRTDERLCQYTEDLYCGKYDYDGDEEQAIDMIIENAQKYKSDFFVLAIGPLTNIAKSILKNPSAMEQIGGIIMMGGEYKHQYVEWNILCDKEASKTVFESRIPIIAFGHELTSLLRLDDSQNNQLMNLGGSSLKSYIGELCRLWNASKENKYNILLHDLTVMRYIVDSSCIQLKEIPCKFIDEGPARGLTLNLENFWWFNKYGKKIKIGYLVDEREFVQYFMDVINNL